MKILTMSDSHSKHCSIPKEWLQEADTIIHAGDISNRGDLYEIEDFLKWFDTLEYSNKIFCAGNHDWLMSRDPEKVAKILVKYPGITYLQDSFVVIDGLKIYGSPHQPFFHNWAFNLQRGKEIKEKWDLIPNDCDIVITHGPCSNTGYLDMTVEGQSVGCQDLYEAMLRVRPKIHCSGHVHEGYGYYSSHDNPTTFINASVLNRRYEISNRPILVEIDENKHVEFL